MGIGDVRANEHAGADQRGGTERVAQRMPSVAGVIRLLSHGYCPFWNLGSITG